MKTKLDNITINYDGESISLPVIHNGVDPKWILELREYLQDILDQFPKDFLKTYYPLSYTTTIHNTLEVVHVIIFQLKNKKTPLELTDTTKEEIINLFYDPDFSFPDRPTLLQTPSSVIIINPGSC